MTSAVGARGDSTGSPTGLVFHLIVHTHWDREWYQSAATFGVRLIEVLDDLLARLRAEPRLRSFLLDGQTVLIEDYLRARPEREGDVRALVRAGRLQVGPWYVLSDELVPSGEALVRNLMLGQADAERWGGRLEVLYSPDAFGHPAVWPTLAREFGLRYGVLWRGLGGAPGQSGDLYRWGGPDGQEVLLWHMPPAGYEIGAVLASAEGDLAERWARIRNALVARARAPHVPVFVGADHHATPVGVPTLRDKIAALEPEHGVRISRLDEYFQAVAGAGDAAPRLTGELRWSYGYAWTLQGVHATRAHLKRANTSAQLWLERFAEPLAALARRSGGVERRAVLEQTWRRLVRAQFHDALAGCTSDPVARTVEGRLESVRAAAREVSRASLLELVGHDPDVARQAAAPADPALVLWNPAARRRDGVVIADVTWFRRDVLVGPPGARPVRTGTGAQSFALTGPDGRALPVQVLGQHVGQERLDAARHSPDQDEVDIVRVAFRAPPVTGLGWVPLRTAPPMALEEPGVVARGRSLVSRELEVSIQPDGGLLVFDKRSRERYVDGLRLEDAADAGDTYSYAPALARRVVRPEGPVRVRRLAGGPLVAALEARFVFPIPRPGGESGEVAARLVVALHADSACVRCILEIDNQVRSHRLRARVPLNLPGAAVTAGAPFGVVERNALTVEPQDFPDELPVATAPAHRFVAAATGRRGLAVLAPGFFEYEWTEHGDIILTLLRGVGVLSRDDLPTRRGHAAWPLATPEAQCLGRHRIEWALLPLDAETLARPALVERAWEDVYLPLQPIWLREARALGTTSGGVTLEGDGLVLSAVKPARVGAGLVLRCYNASGHRSAGAWRFEHGVRSAHRVRADERESRQLTVENRGKTVRFVAEPREIITLLIT